MARAVVMMGAFPPPVGGAAKINDLVYRALIANHVAVTKIDLAASGLAHNRSFGYHRQRLTRNLRGLIEARQRGATSTALYIVPDGGSGAWYTLAHLAATGQFGSRVIHHHTCRYIEHHSRPIAMIARTHARSATHVFLTEGMASGFQRQYGRVDYIVASNARFVCEEANRDIGVRRAGPLRLGHLSNLCRDKGFFDVADAFEAIRSSGIDAELHVAGPILEPEVAARLAELNSRHGEAVKHAGAVSGERKREFYRALDVFLFPTKWPQEAAPIVVYEALSAGVPVLTSDRGLIPEIVTGIRGAVCPRSVSFTDFVRASLAARDHASMDHRRSILINIRAECAASIAQYGRLLTLLSGVATIDNVIGES